MILEMKVPSPGESIMEVEIASWLVKDGDYVSKDQAIAEIDSDKATLDLSAQESGVITLKVEAGQTIPVGGVVCHIDISEIPPEVGKDDKPQTPKKEEKVKVENPSVAALQNTDSYSFHMSSPAARKILAEKRLSSDQVRRTGKAGRVTKYDAVQAVASMGSQTTAARSFQVSRLSKLRRKLSERLVSVKNEMAMLTTFNEVDMSEVFRLRKQFKEAFKEKHGINLGFMSFFTKSCVRALQLYPDINAMIDGKNKTSFEYCDISVAVSGPKGLMVPVLRNAELLCFRGVEQEIKRLATRVQDGEISVDEMTGGTFTITNGGVFGSMLSTPIINPPQSAILGMHNVVERPVAIQGKLEIRPIMYVALSYDHRIIDGKESVGFLVAVKEAIEDPFQHLMGSNPQAALEL
ncbi:MAG: 2-oxoglutarate dehydrogenase complex dihydrolipoyllysine-residue succinyltransferase [Flavobacteriales bacterium Tduv]